MVAGHHGEPQQPRLGVQVRVPRVLVAAADDQVPGPGESPGHQLTLCRAAAAHLSVQRKIPTSTRPSDISTFMFLLSQDLSSVTPGLSVEAEGGIASSSMMPQTATIYDLT